MGVKYHEISASIPNKHFSCKEVFHLKRIASVEAENFQRHIGESTLSVVRIKVHQDENDIIRRLLRKNHLSKNRIDLNRDNRPIS